MGTEMEIRHLRREVKTALEMAVVELAPSVLLDRLASSAGILEALGELPVDCAPAVALMPNVVQRAKRNLDDWRKWEREKGKKAVA